MKNIVKAIALGLGVMVLGIIAQSDPASATSITYYFDLDYCSTSCLNGASGGSITLDDSNSTGDVSVSVSLSGVNFHDKGLDSFTFNLSGNPTISITSLSDSNFALVSPTAGAIKMDGAGSYEYALNCPLCGPQAGGDVTSTLSFHVLATGLTIASFDEFSTLPPGSQRAIFAASVFNTANSSCTGVIGSDTTSNSTASTWLGNGSSNCAAVPEPSSLLLLGSGLVALGLWGRRRFKVRS